MGISDKEESLKMILAIIFIGTLLSISKASNASFDDADAGWIRSGDYFYLISQENMNWFEARQFCQDHHGYLAEIKTEEEQMNVNQILPSGRLYWIGLEDFSREGNFIWDNSKEDVEFSNWDEGQPDAYYDDEDCVNMSSNGTWNDVGCFFDDWNGALHAVCQDFHSSVIPSAK